MIAADHQRKQRHESPRHRASPTKERAATAAIYASGSRIQGTANAQSDLDLAVLVSGYAEPLPPPCSLASDPGDIADCPVDLLDLRAASTVMQYQITTTGERWWSKDAQASLFETAILSEKPRSIAPARDC